MQDINLLGKIMIKNINTKMKLLLFPFMFVIIVIVSGFVYLHYSGVENSRNQVAIQTEEFIQQLLKGRISVYQFLRAPTDANKQKVIDNFKTLDDEVIELRAKLVYQKNIELSNEILASSKEYVNNFNAVALKIVENQNNGIKEETEQIKNTIKTMSESGVVLESKIVEINKNALQLKDEAHSLLSNILLILVVVSVLVFIAFSLLISNIVTKSLTDFKNGLLSFFD